MSTPMQSQPQAEPQRARIKDLLAAEEAGAEAMVKGWVKTVRSSGGVAFVQVNDGSTLADLQIVVDAGCPDYPLVGRLTTGCSVSAAGTLRESPGRGQRYEVAARRLELVGGADPEQYPLQKKRHTLEFLRELAHLRPRTNTFGAVARRAQRHGLWHSPVFPGTGVSVHPDAHYYGQRCRGGRAQCFAPLPWT